MATLTTTISYGEPTGTIVATLGTPGPQGQPGPQGIQGVQGDPGVGVPTGGSAGQYLVKASGTNFDTEWAGLDLSIYARIYSPVFTGDPKAPTPATSDNDTSIATTAFVKAQGYLTISSASGIYLSKAGNLSGLANTSESRANLGLGSIATAAAADYAVTARGMPSGGLAGQVLLKNSIFDYDASWSAIDFSAYATLAYVNTSFYGINNPDGFITAAYLDDYLTIVDAANTYAITERGMPASGTVGQVLSKNSGANYDASWETFIPGDRYLTTSTTSNAVSNGAKTFTVGTGLSYTPTQDVTIAYDAAHHMHATVTTYNSGTGVLVVDVNSHTGTGTYTYWTVNVGGAVPAVSVTWGDVVGVLGDQLDLANALNAKLEITDAASTYQTISGMSSWLTTADAATTYFPLSGGALNNNSNITIADTGLGSDSEMGGFGFGVENTAQTQQASIEFAGVSINSSIVDTYGTTTKSSSLTTSALSTSTSGYDSFGAYTDSLYISAGGFSTSRSGSVTNWSFTVNPAGITSTYNNYSDHTTFSVDGFNGIQWNNGSVNGQFGPSGIRFADGSTQTTAYTGGGSVSWGSISGSISSQTDLQSALDSKYSTSNPSNFVDGSGAINAISSGYTSSVNNSPSGGQFLKYNGSQLEWSSPSGGSPTYSESVWIYNQWYSATIQTVYNTSYSYVNVLTF